MKKPQRLGIYAVGLAVCAMGIRYIICTDSLFACLAVAITAVIIDSMLRMCDRLLDPPPAIFRLIAPDLWEYSRESNGHHRNDGEL